VTIIIIIAPIRCCMHQRSCVIVKKKTFLFLFLYTALDIMRTVHIIITFLFSSPFLSLIICARPSLICIYKDLPPYFSSHNSYPDSFCTCLVNLLVRGFTRILPWKKINKRLGLVIIIAVAKPIHL
jgi:hypothetical protein